MLHPVKLVKTSYSSLKARLGRRHLRQQLLALDARRLADAGLSRPLLEAGVRAWPWREAEVATLPLGVALKPKKAGTDPKTISAQAIAELQAYSDAELAALGLRRGDIEHAVRLGRPGIDDCNQFAA